MKQPFDFQWLFSENSKSANETVAVNHVESVKTTQRGGGGYDINKDVLRTPLPHALGSDVTLCLYQLFITCLWLLHILNSTKLQT